MRARQSAVFAAVFLVASPALADGKDTCINAYEQTQTLRKDGKFVTARQQASICAKDSCPALLAKDCTKWSAELETQTPSVVIEAKNAAGADVQNVSVKVDGVAVVEKLDGKPIPVDPGSRVFRFETEGAAPIEKTVVLKEGEKSHKIPIAFAPLAATAPVAPETSGDRPIPAAVWIFGGVSVAALATSAVFTIDGLGKKSDLDGCKPHCNADDVDAMNTRFTFADVALGAGVVAAAATLYLFFSRPSAAAPTRIKEGKDGSQARLRLLPGGVGGRF